jgi:hypothetical protein
MFSNLILHSRKETEIMNRKLRLLVMLFTLCFSYVVNAQSQKYKRVKLYASAKELHELASAGLSIDHGFRKENFIVIEISNEELNVIKAKNIKHEVLVEDLENYYAHQNDGVDIKSLNKSFKSLSSCGNSSTISIPQNFNLGSYAGFMTYQEMLDNIDSMATKYPNLISPRYDFDTIVTIQNRPVYWMRLSDNPITDEGEPEMLFTAVHHAREPTSMSETIFFMWYLLENYATNPEIKFLVDNTELYFVPCVNPDGYLYNETTQPAGGGLWRKNRRANSNNTFGVDLNRNYGYMWGQNNGSSPTPSSDTYRGPVAFSEPETRMMKQFCETHHFITAFNAHTYGNDLIYPWGHQTNTLTPDSTLFDRWGKKMVEVNNYLSGLGSLALGYYTSGDSDDWMYGEQNTKVKIFSMTPEVGADVQPSGFWPPANQITDICIDAASMNLNAVRLLTAYAEVKDKSPKNISITSYYQKYSIERLGYDSTASYTVSITPIQNVVSAGASVNYAHLNIFDLKSDSILLTLTPTIQDGDIFKFVINSVQGGFTYHDTIIKVFGNGLFTYNNTCDNTNNMSATGSWGPTSTLFYSAPSAITESPNGNYGNNINTEIVLLDTINLQNGTQASLSFWTRWNIEAGYDYVQVSAKATNTNVWTPLCGLYTKNGNANQAINEPLYDGFQSIWLEEQMDLTSYMGQKINIKFSIVSDGATTYDGFYFDDLKVRVFGDSTVGVQEKSNQNTITFYPNPVKNQLTISNITRTTNLIISNMLGAEIRNINTTNNNSIVIDVTDLSQGLYLLKDASSGIFYKFVKN